MRAMQHNGLYKILSLNDKDLSKVNCFSIWILRFGQIINYYSCLFAVIGSFFIIFETNKGDNGDDGVVDYSHSGLEMV